MNSSTPTHHFVLEWIDQPHPTSDRRCPQAGQVVRLSEFALDFEGQKEEAFRINRPSSEFDNSIWNESDFDQNVLFYPRIRGYSDLLVSPRECNGSILVIAASPLQPDEITRAATDFRWEFTCSARPLNAE